MTIDVPLGDMGQALLATNQLTTIDQSELSAQLGLGLVGGAMLQESPSPDDRLSPAASPTVSLPEDDMDDFSRVSRPFLDDVHRDGLFKTNTFLLQGDK